MNQFNKMCIYHQTSSNSNFTKSKVISLSKPKGRITLTNNTLKISNDGIVETTEFEPIEFEDYLNKYFEIQIAIKTND